VLAIVGNSVGTLAAVVVALRGLRRRTLGNGLILAGIAVAALGSALAGLGEAESALFSAAAAALLYGGFVVPDRGSA
jgi:Flp pilus assembly protein protease CpaA